MTAVVVRRPARRPAPGLPSGEILLEAPPEIPPPAERQWAQTLTMLPMLVIMAAFVLMFSGSMAGTLRLVVFALFGAALVVMLVVVVLRGGGAGGRQMGHARRAYLRGLSRHRLRMRRGVDRHREALAYLHPEPGALWAVAAGPRLWERRPGDADFAVVRVGVGPQSPMTVLVPPETGPLEQLDPLCALALRRFLLAYAQIPDLPLALHLTGFGRIRLAGERTRVLSLVRALIAQVATLHAPDDVRVAVCAGRAELRDWEWVKWLPHALHPHRADAAGPVRLIGPTAAALEDLLADRPRFDPGGDRGAAPQLVVIVDGGDPAGSEHPAAGLEGVTVVQVGTSPLPSPDPATLTLTVDAGGTLAASTTEGRTEIGRADALDVVAAEALARELAPLRLGGGSGDGVPAGDLGLADLLGLGDPYAFDPDRTWVPRPVRDRLRVMFGVRGDGTPVELDLKESALDGMGPHGLLIGATGCGKSELLRTRVLALAVTHPPASLNFVLIDFKGGATFARMDALPHTSAVITNLKYQLPLVDRMADALTGELIRRQELLRAAGTFSSMHEYEHARLAGADLPEVATLLIVCDEFSELLTEKPEFIDTFVQIGRVGRALGVHLLLASQRLEEGRLRGLDGHLSYRIGLRTFAAMESRAVLGVTDAFELPRAPGHGLMRYGTEALTRFRAAYVSGVHRRPEPGTVPDHPAAARIVEYTAAGRPEPAPAPRPADPAEGTGASLLDILVDRLTGRGTPAHVVWLPPLAESPTLDGLPQPPAGRLRAVAGVVDRPLEQRRDPLELDLSGSAGHVLVTGGPRSGRSTALRTLIASLALAHSPREVQFYCLDFGGGALAALRGLPHVGEVTGRQNPGAVRRTVAQLASLLAERERRFAEHDVEGIAAYRRARARGEFGDDPYGDVFLVVDGWLTLRKEFDDLDDTIADLAARGLTYGVHLIGAGLRAFDLRPAVRDLFGSRIELRLGDPVDSAVDRTSAGRVPVSSPGRGLAPSKHHLLVALPRLDGVCSPEGLPEATAALVRDVASRWPGDRAPRVRLLPADLPYANLPARDDGLSLTIGIDEQNLAPVRLDLTSDPHALLLGDARSGKTGFLRLLARRIADSHTPRQARIVVIDHRRSLLGDVGGEHLLGHGTEPVSTRRLVAEIARGMAERAPGPDVTPEQLRTRSWWGGPELFVLIDDYDLVVSPADNPLQPLLPYLPQARELGLHVIVTRRTGGAGRALFEPFLTRLRDVGSPGVLLSGDRAEGPLLGGLKAEALPPGRGRLITRTEKPRLLQLAWTAPAQ